MKTTIILILSVLFLSSCEKCIECKTARAEREYCKGDDQFDYVKNGGQLKDETGVAFVCVDKK